MILEFLLISLMNVVQTIFSVLPDIPAVPAEISAVVDWINSSLETVSGFLKYVFSPALFSVVLGMIVTVIFFEQIYHSVMWTLRKIPVLGIK